MSIQAEVTAIVKGMGLPINVGKLQDFPPNEYIVLTPLPDVFEVFADNLPNYETQAVRISLYTKQNYQKRKNQLVKALLANELTVTGRKYIDYDGDTSYYHYVIDVEKEYMLEEDLLWQQSD